MKRYLLPEKGSFYKANLHSHSTLSDGRLTPEELKAVYMSRGYSVLAYTDHDVFIPHHELTDDNFVALAGFEAAFNQYDIYPAKSREVKACHFCFIAKTPNIKKQPCWNPKYAYVGNAKAHHADVIPDENSLMFERYYKPERINEMINICREAGFFITYNHSSWSLENYSDYSGYDGIHAMEILNYGCERSGYDAYQPNVYDDLLRCGKRIFAVAADDNHNKYPIESPYSDSFGGFVMIKAEKLSYTDVTDALFTGSFYASSGPEIYSLYIENGEAHITCSDAKKITITTDRRLVKSAIADEGKTVNCASFRVDEDVKYIRFTVKDSQGRFANTNAYFINS